MTKPKIEYLDLALSKPNRHMAYIEHFVIRGEQIQEDRPLPELNYDETPIGNVEYLLSQKSIGLEDVVFYAVVERGRYQDDDAHLGIGIKGWRKPTQEEAEKISEAKKQRNKREDERTQQIKTRELEELARLEKKYNKKP